MIKPVVEMYKGFKKTDTIVLDSMGNGAFILGIFRKYRDGDEDYFAVYVEKDFDKWVISHRQLVMTPYIYRGDKLISEVAQEIGEEYFNSEYFKDNLSKLEIEFVSKFGDYKVMYGITNE